MVEENNKKIKKQDRMKAKLEQEIDEIPKEEDKNDIENRIKEK